MADDVGDGVERDPGGSGRRRRPPTARSPTRRAPCSTCSSASMPGRRGLPRPPRPRADHPPHRRRAQRRRVRPALQPGAAAVRTPSARTWPRTARRGCATTSPRTRSTAALAMQQRVGAGSYLGVPLELSDGTRVGSLAALSREPQRLPRRPTSSCSSCSRASSRHELERESNERDLRRFNDMLRDQAQGMAARRPRRHGARRGRRRPHGRSARPPARSRTRRSPSCSSPRAATSSRRRCPACEMQPVTIQPRGDGRARRRKAFTVEESYFVADARDHPALAAPLVEATDGALRAVRAGRCATATVAGVLIVIWQRAARGAAGVARRRAAAGGRAGRDRHRARRPARRASARWR